MNNDLIQLIPVLPFIVNQEDINEATKVEGDLGLYGYQARRFIFQYGDMFNVDISNFKFDKYFSKDTPFHKFRQKLPSFLRGKKHDITLGQLQAAIAHGKLNDVVLHEIATSDTDKIPHKKLILEDASQFKPEDILMYILTGVAITILLSAVALMV